MSISSALSSLGGVASTIAGLIIPGASALPDLVKAGESAIAAFNSLKNANGGTAPPDAQSQHDALVAKIKAHAEGTLDRLEGKGG